jgi:flagellar secretion chaperone FliS
MQLQSGYTSRYQESQVLTVSREQLLLLTYDGILRFLGRALRGLQQQDLYEKHLGLTKAESLIMELRRTLDFSASPELAHNLSRIYTYLVQQLAAADVEDDEGRIRHAIDLVTELRSAWVEAARQLAAEAGGGER